MADFVEASVFAQVSFQFCGHLDEYLVSHVRHVGLFYAQTRFGKGGHRVCVYEAGRLVEERWLPSSRNVFLYYLRTWWQWHCALRRFAHGRKNATAIFSHPLNAFALRLRPRVRHVFWQWDWFPGGGLTNRLFNAVARFYAPRVQEYHPLTAAIGKAVGMSAAKPMMLGVVPPEAFGDPASNRLLLVGQLRHGQGVEDVLDFLAAHPQYALSLMGAGAGGFGDEIRARIASAKMEDRVYFPDRFVDAATLRAEAAKCFAALALYDVSPDNFTHYADPGKVKNAIEMGLPVVMTRISEIVPFLARFKAGEVIDSLAELPAALAQIKRDPETYFAGCRAFARHFDCEKQYAWTAASSR